LEPEPLAPGPTDRRHRCPSFHELLTFRVALIRVL
jgi:hypothetical protein